MDNKNNVFETLGHSEGSEKEQDPIDLKLVRTGGEGGPLYYLSYGIDGKDVEQKNDGYLDMEKAIEYAKEIAKKYRRSVIFQEGKSVFAKINKNGVEEK
ncbi:MAG: hypothetical protein US45_C0054G0003 [Candidatus Nomurabacteria bacterium GW2011_GWA1_37_20]|uniref:Uncharacterized protein n=2 Tax=Parcubacteria group TaxID=1794811 RepID=A0A0G0HX38_9BACT|nr:MAG: hypothetical protein US33_C0002G0014 [Parcubacteria group bacterium GW2011_GWC1_36_9]KKQ29924.1 MAG: hypothetical protein US45_C0054G0003 [Candidatus Nomurabacteria bacterium GW2011_GWA1_37_20]KKQ46867.1 MAG: hypothetical protein US65_C0024G0008 [Candidatus Yanofskybacteria bacterium GW2011_GWC2_37_9]